MTVCSGFNVYNQGSTIRMARWPVASVRVFQDSWWNNHLPFQAIAALFYIHWCCITILMPCKHRRLVFCDIFYIVIAKFPYFIILSNRRAFEEVAKMTCDNLGSIRKNVLKATNQSIMFCIVCQVALHYCCSL